ITSGDIALLNSNGAITINQDINAPTGNIVTLSATTTITQGAGDFIIDGGLELKGTADVTLENAGNTINTIAGDTSGTVKFVNSTGLTVGAVGTSTGFSSSATRDIKLEANGAGGNLVVNEQIKATGGLVTLQSTAGSISQAAAGVITADTLGVNA